MTQEPNIFPYIARLLQGAEVVWKPLGEIASMYGGLTGKNKTDFEEGNASYITYKNIFDNIEVDFDKLEKVKISPSEKQNKVRYGDVLFTGSSETAEDAGMSSAITTTIEEDIYLNSFSFGIRFNEDVKLIPEFSKYLFRSHFMRAAISKTASGVTRFNISKERLKKLSIPLPPLSVQQEIVRILDKFTQLEAELEAELDCRKRQYEYYRNKLLSYEGNEVEWKTLGEVGTFIRGNGLQKKDFVETGIGCIHYGQIYTYYGIKASKIISYVTEDLAKSLRKASHNDLIIAAVSENIEDVCKCVVWEGEEDICVSGDTFIFKTDQNPHYIGHLLRTDNFLNYKRKNAVGAKVTRLQAGSLPKYAIPLPQIEEQNRIVAILDKFDTLVNSISEGLPKEIALRRKQYEYYREKLLSFPKQ